MSNKCCKEVKSLTQLEKHSKCSSNIGSKILFGHLLNKYLKAHTFNNGEKHRAHKACCNHSMLKSGTMPKLNYCSNLGTDNNSNNPKILHVPPRKPDSDEKTQSIAKLS